MKDIQFPNHYDPSRYAKLFSVEDRHFWFRVRNQVICSLVSQIISTLPHGYNVLEVGCGTGNVLRLLEKTCQNGSVYGMDLFMQGIDYASSRSNCSLIQGDIRNPPFSNKFHLIGLFDVLEHLSDDIGALKNLHGLLVNSGALLITVPAHPELWSYWDDAACHCRRYQFDELSNKLLEAGFKIEYLSFYQSLIFPLMWLKRVIFPRIGKRQKKAEGENSVEDDLTIIPIANEILAFLLKQEIHLIKRRMKLPFGSSLLAVARKLT